MTGSILPSRALAVRSTPYFSSAWKVPSGSGLVTRAEPRTAGQRVGQAPDGLAPDVDLVGQREQQVLGRDVLVAAVAGLALGAPRARRAAPGRPAGPTAPPAGAGSASTRRCAAARTAQRVDADGLQQRAGQALGVVEQRDEQVGRLDGRVAALGGGLDGRRDGLLAAGGQIHLRFLGGRFCSLFITHNASKVESVPLKSLLHPMGSGALSAAFRTLG